MRVFAGAEVAVKRRARVYSGQGVIGVRACVWGCWLR